MPLLFSLSPQAPAPPKPLVVALSREPDSAERALLALPAADRDAKLKSGGYDVREFERFVLVTPHDLLHLEAARSQASLLKAVARQAADGTRTIAARDLDGPDGAALRDLVRQGAGRDGVLADAPDFRVGLGVDTTFHLENRGRTKDFVAHPTGPGFGKDTSRMRRPAAGDPTKPPPASKEASRAFPSTGPTGRLTFLLPPGVDGTAGMEWIAEAQTALLKEAREARARWDEAKAGLLAALRSDAEGIFAKTPDRMPRFDDLKPELQYRWGMMFVGPNSSDLGGADPISWLHGARTLGIQTEPLLQLRIASGTDSTTTQSTDVTDIPFVCPVGP